MNGEVPILYNIDSSTLQLDSICKLLISFFSARGYERCDVISELQSLILISEVILVCMGDYKITKSRAFWFSYRWSQHPHKINVVGWSEGGNLTGSGLEGFLVFF